MTIKNTPVCKQVNCMVCEFYPGTLCGISLNKSSSCVKRCLGLVGSSGAIDGGGGAWWTTAFLGFSMLSLRTQMLASLSPGRERNRLCCRGAYIRTSL